MSEDSPSLPIDIPWQRLCVSRDMVDTEVCDRDFPHRWRSSVAVFAYEPPTEYQTYDGMLISYLKVVSTITGFQPDPKEVGLTDRRIDSYWNTPAVIETYQDVLAKYYPCYGAIVEVAIGPRGMVTKAAETTDWREIPYFADFQPKKRELYETVSETGEVMSRSLDTLKVHKGATTSETHEVLDIFGGFTAKAKVGDYGGDFGVTGQWGTKDITKEEYQNVRTSDRAREQRETFSHTTQLSQMYHQMNSYHLGTNRAVFYLLPRPHVVQSPMTFVNGPREMEGIQELFLVVLRPDDQAPPCVEAYLETAHIVKEPILKHDTSVDTLTIHIERNCDDTSGSLGDDSNTRYKEASETYTPPDGWEIDLARDGGYQLNPASGHRIEGYAVTSVGKDHLTLWGKVSSRFEDRTWPESNVCYKGRLDGSVSVYIRKKKAQVIGHNDNLWLTGRGVCCCDRHEPDWRIAHDWVVFEAPIAAAKTMADAGAPFPKAVKKQEAAAARVLAANLMRDEVGRLMISSRGSGERYAFGTVGAAETTTVGRLLAKVVRTDDNEDNVELSDIRGLSRKIRDKVREVAPKVSRGRLLQMSIQEQMDRFDLDLDEVMSLRRAAVGLEGRPPRPAERWDGPEGLTKETTKQSPKDARTTKKRTK